MKKWKCKHKKKMYETYMNRNTSLQLYIGKNQDMGFVAVILSLLRKTLKFLRAEMAIISQFQYIFSQHTFNFVAHSILYYFFASGYSFFHGPITNIFR